MLLHQVGKLDEVLSSLLRCDLSPWAFEGLAGGSDSNVDILLGSFLNGADDRLVGGVDDLECLVLLRLDEFTVDETGRGSVRHLQVDHSLVGLEAVHCRQLTGQWAARTPHWGS